MSSQAEKNPGGSANGKASAAGGKESGVRVVGGLGLFPFSEDFYVKAVCHALDSARVPHSAFSFNRTQLLQVLSSGCLRVLIVISETSEGYEFDDPLVKSAIVPWVESGGVLILQGEKRTAILIREWFKKAGWTLEGDCYRRTSHTLNVAHPAISAEGGFLSKSALPTDYNVKALMLGDVPSEERLYMAAEGSQTSQSAVFFMSGLAVDPRRCPFALGRFGSGYVAFVGDVNAEESTTKIVATLVQQFINRSSASSASTSLHASEKPI